MGGDQLVPALVCEQVDKEKGDEIQQSSNLDELRKRLDETLLG